MKLGKVIGTVVASAHHRAYDGRTVLLVQPQTPQGEPAAKAFVAIDTVQAGIGDQVLVITEGTGVRQILEGRTGPKEAVEVLLSRQLRAENE